MGSGRRLKPRSSHEPLPKDQEHKPTKDVRNKGRFVKGYTPPGAQPWRRGQSGNKSGQPKGYKSLTVAIQKLLAQPFPGDPEGRLCVDVLAQEWYKGALRAGMEGDATGMLKMLLDRNDGVIEQKLKTEIESTQTVKRFGWGDPLADANGEVSFEPKANGKTEEETG
ncbi:hypothetical protein LCGC14_2685740 [marine sediment metagenome]|uniref:DUF5681 domain-containing protein n=1 Tax=marine sediment metagenome TaxID=412755 RepID=A0A0F9A7I2_9ZZZZ